MKAHLGKFHRGTGVHKMFKNVLVPIDLVHIEQGKALVKSAMKLDQMDQGELILLHVLPSVPGYVSALIPEEVTRKSRERALKQLEQIALELGISDIAKTVVLVGTVHIEILAWADDADVDLIVMASHQPEFADYLIGTTAARVVRHANCSVLVVRNL